MNRSDPAPYDDDKDASFSAWWMLLILMSLYMFSLIDRQIISLLTSTIITERGYSDLQMSILMGPAFSLFYAVFGIPLGWASDRFNRRPLLWLGVTLFSLATIASGLARGFHELLLARIAVGIGEAVVTPAAISLIADSFPRRRITTATAIYQTGIKLGMSAAFGLGALLIGLMSRIPNATTPWGEHLSVWQLVLIAIGTPGLLLALLVFTFPEPLRKGRLLNARPPRLLDAIPFYKKNAALLARLIIGFGLVNIATQGMTAWIPTYIQRQFGWSSIETGSALGLTSLIAAGTLVVKGMAVDWFMQRGVIDIHVRFFIFLLIVALPNAVFMFFVSDGDLFIILYAIVFVAISQYFVYVVSAMQLFTPNEFRGQLTALLLMVFQVVGGGVAPVAIASLAHLGYSQHHMLGYALLIVVAGSMFCGLLVLETARAPLKKAINAARDSALDPERAKLPC